MRENQQDDARRGGDSDNLPNTRLFCNGKATMKVMEEMAERGIRPAKNIKMLEYINNMHEYISSWT